MLPEEIFKRRHFGTPQSFFLITANCVVIILAMQLFAACTQISIYFWVTISLLTLYNIYSIHRERETYDKARIIGYVISLAALLLLFFTFRHNAPRC